MIPVRIEFLWWNVTNRPMADSTSEILMTRWNPTLMISTCIRGAQMPVALIKETPAHRLKSVVYVNINPKSSNAKLREIVYIGINIDLFIIDSDIIQEDYVERLNNYPLICTRFICLILLTRHSSFSLK